jgi:hypothetical protein
MSAISNFIKFESSNAVASVLQKVSSANGQEAADDVAAGYLAGIANWLKNTRGPRLAYDAFQIVADDIAETMIAEPRS